MSVGGALSGLAGFGTAVRTGGLDAGIAALGLGELRGLSAVQVIARVAEHLAETADGPQADLLATALRDAIFECVALESGGSYEDLDDGLQAYLSRDGVEGLVESFLSQFVFDRVWAWIETHSNKKSDSVAETQALESAVDGACRANVKQLMDDVRSEGRFDRTDWFGREGVDLGRGIVSTLEFRLQSFHNEESS